MSRRTRTSLTPTDHTGRPGPGGSEVLVYFRSSSWIVSPLVPSDSRRRKFRNLRGKGVGLLFVPGHLQKTGLISPIFQVEGKPHTTPLDPPSLHPSPPVPNYLGTTYRGIGRDLVSLHPFPSVLSSFREPYSPQSRNPHPTPHFGYGLSQPFI